ncbi:hypothetical protein BD809_10550 [Aquimarina intermedia]|uniref:Uncharacterized protein n=1 Tax=Aquimarina intermedia TaxID=350814 RepID=A0A5S5C664_9FLAO|nr:hypothetical protein BD809_10550 [Aquimarina intermedia]
MSGRAESRLTYYGFKQSLDSAQSDKVFLSKTFGLLLMPSAYSKNYSPICIRIPSE